MSHSEALWELAYAELGSAERIVRGRVDLQNSRVLSHVRDEFNRPRRRIGVHAVQMQCYCTALQCYCSVTSRTALNEL